MGKRVAEGEERGGGRVRLVLAARDKVPSYS